MNSARKRVLLLTQWYEPEPTFKGSLFATELIRRGYDVEVVTGYPNYPGGKLYPGYSLSWKSREVVAGVSVTRLWLYPSHDASALRRLANYASFALSAFLHCCFSARKPDVIYVYQLPTLAFAAVLIKMLFGTAVVFDIQDLWPDSLRATGMMRSEGQLRAVGHALDWIYARVSAIVVLSPGFAKALVTRGVQASKIRLIYNWCDEAALMSPESADASAMPGPEFFTIVFAGNLGKAQSLCTVLDAAAMLAKTARRIRFVFIGGGVELPELRARAEAEQLHNVVFIPRVPMNQVGAYLRAADAVLVHLKRDPLFEITIPGKTQAYMAMGKPILMAVKGDAAELVRISECGVEAEPGNPKSIAQAAVYLASLDRSELKEMGARATRYYRDNLSLEVGAKRFAEVFESVLGGRVATRSGSHRK